MNRTFDPMPLLIRADARSLPLADVSVDLIVTSPPYWSLRSYSDNGEHYATQIGSEPTWQDYLDALIECTREWMRVLKPTGSMWVNLGDVFSTGQRSDNEFTVEDAAWLGGVIDSDGSISIRVANDGRSHVTWVRVGQMRREVVEQIGRVTGKGQVWQDGRGVWNWTASTRQARWVLERIWPWLHIKRRQALAGVELMELKAQRKAKGSWNKLTQDDLQRRERIRQAVLAWNRGDVDDYEPQLLPLPDIPLEARRVQPKSLLLLPHRYAVRCADELGLIVRQDQVWSKVNGLPESVTDRTRRSHEYLFHLVKQPRYYSAVDEIREPHTDTSAHAANRRARSDSRLELVNGGQSSTANPLGKLPGSVWEVASQSLNVPDSISHARCCASRKRKVCEEGLDHYAAFPFALVRPIVLGWSPREVCTACGEGRRPVVVREFRLQPDVSPARNSDHGDIDPSNGWGSVPRGSTQATIVGYSCICPDGTAPTTPGVVVDPFGGTAAAPLVAAMAGRVGISVDASWDYCDLIARWRINDPKERARAVGLRTDAVARIDPVADQGSLFDEAAS